MKDLKIDQCTVTEVRSNYAAFGLPRGQTNAARL